MKVDATDKARIRMWHVDSIFCADTHYATFTSLIFPSYIDVKKKTFVVKKITYLFLPQCQRKGQIYI